MQLGHAQEEVTRLTVLFLLVKDYPLLQVRNVSLNPCSRRLGILQGGENEDGQQNWQAKFHARTFRDSRYSRLKNDTIQNGIERRPDIVWLQLAPHRSYAGGVD